MLVAAGRAGLARQALKKALDLDARDEKAHANLAALMCRFGDAEGARERAGPREVEARRAGRRPGVRGMPQVSRSRSRVGPGGARRSSALALAGLPGRGQHARGQPQRDRSTWASPRSRCPTTNAAIVVGYHRPRGEGRDVVFKLVAYRRPERGPRHQPMDLAPLPGRDSASATCTRAVADDPIRTLAAISSGC